ncbi:MAG: YbaB/EbfC family nucleoid-associated protein [Clostridia bacterium]|jgi:DNA-binding YbaB/EbfC family protein|nr:YbaB/EbfC family nucleoid-associated protein [Clostridia bacterium]MCI9460051.1 YbaB/EbfC family nucleoid-associated protein [Clostridia bacterium]
MGKFGYGGGGGGMNMQQMMKQAQKLQQQMAEAKEELENARVTGTAGGGAVAVTISGSKRFLSIEIKPEVVDPDDVEMLEDLITAAANEAYAEADELVKNSPLSQLGGL